MIKFAVGLAIIVFTFIMGIYRYMDLSTQAEDRAIALEDALSKRDEGKNLSKRINKIRRTSIVTDDAEKFKIERLLDIGNPGMEWRFVGQPLVRGSNKALYRYTFRVSGPSTFAESQALLQRMNKLPGFVVYRYCFACTQTPRNTAEELRMVQIEGFMYAYDAKTL